MNAIKGLWRVSLQSLDRPTNQIKHLHQVNGKENFIKYLHTAVFSPVQDTWDKSVNRGYFNTRPESLQMKSTRWQNMRPPSRYVSHIAGKTPDQQQPKRAAEKTRGTHIMSKNQITTRQSLWWPQWAKLTISTLTRWESSQSRPVGATSIYWSCMYMIIIRYYHHPWIVYQASKYCKPIPNKWNI